MYNILKRMIEQKNYETKEELQTKLDVFYALNRIKGNEYTELTNLLNKESTLVEPKIWKVLFLLKKLGGNEKYGKLFYSN